jgi:hypothetical protein
MLTEGVRRAIPVVVGTAAAAAPARTSTGARRSSGRSPARKAALQLGNHLRRHPQAPDPDAHEQGPDRPPGVVPPLTGEVLDASVNSSPYGDRAIQKALLRCQVVLAVRCYDPAVFAALPIMRWLR